MTWNVIAGALVWAGAGAALLYVLMTIDTLLTRYKDFDEIKKGNMAVTLRFVMKLFAQGYILSQSIRVSNDLLEGLFVSIVSFVILLILEFVVRIVLSLTTGLKLADGTQAGKVTHGLIAGSLHVVGALIIAAYIAP
ncbi:DUF350 domain-containing protein [Paenibacillus albiflavus]|uniref:DUF350 domain-containing protein n=1 Tax=Paenibacillus albiflavus TaxID=2545760 RepID=A0A4R4EJB3_9BACL|nr:DUF350 domain-containing protein [Paenibacillus albiflavus]TCZ80039.1 DUF350 domain-containing protein [Paenibacillus albiflavus]